MRTTYLYYLLLFASFLSVSKAQEIGYPIIRNYLLKEYNSSPQVYGAIQDNRGIMYFGGYGVTEYDGVSWKNIPIAKQTFVFDFAKDLNNRIYVSAIDEFGYLETDQKGNTIYKSLTHLISDTTFALGQIRLVKLTSKFVYFQSADAILQYSPLNQRITIFEADTNGRFLGDFVYRDTYFVRSQKIGLLKIQNNELKPAFQSDFFRAENKFYSALHYDASTLLIPTRTNGLYLYKPDKDTVPIKFNINGNDFIKENDIYTASALENGYFVLGSLKKGALLIDKNGKALMEYKESNLLQSTSVKKIANDKSQNIWFGLENGISKTGSSIDLSFWGKHSGLNGSVLSLMRYDSILYISTNTGVIYIDKNNQIQEIKNIPAGQNWRFLKTKNIKFLLVGTHSGIYEIRGNKAMQIYKGSHAMTLCQSLKNPDRIYSTDFDFLISLKYQDGKWVNEGRWEGIKDDIRGITEDEKGDIWLGTYSNGVIRITPNNNDIIKPQKIRYYNLKDGFVSLIDILPFRFKNKIIWGTEKGLFKYNAQTDRFEPFCELGDKFCNGSSDVYSLIEMPDGKVWICPYENQGGEMGYLRPNEKGAYDWVYAPFQRIPDMTIDAFYIDDSGIAWIGGNEGIFRYDMSKDTKNYTQKFNCLIRKITIGEDSLIYGGNGSVNNLKDLNYKYNTIKFEFAAPFFDLEEKTLYSYQLDGYDKGWSKWSRETKKEYTNLPEGAYTIKVKALNVYGVESEIDTYLITVLPPYYRTWWAYGIYAITIIMFIWIIIKLNTYRHKKEKEHLENTVKLRTTEIVKQKNEILVQNEEIQAQKNELEQTNDKLRQMGEFKQGMTSMIVHDLKNPLNLILNLPQAIIPEKQISIMQQSGKQMLNMVLNILDVDKYEEMSMNLNLEEKQFVLIAINAIKQVQFLCEQKDITIRNLVDKNLFTKVEEEIAERILINLLTNAIKYSPLNSGISLKSNLISEAFVRIEIQDSGEGIPKDKIHLVFQKFGQVIAKKSGGVRSTGLGLTFCKLAVEAHGGEIGVTSEVGKGTTFWFTLQTGTSKNSIIEIIEQEMEINDEPLEFTEQEKAILEPIIKRLKVFSVYETSDIEEVVEELKHQKAVNVQKWVARVKANLITLNQTKYADLLKLNSC